ncbi:hypothetical protein ACFRQM_33375 [Streptomyces sp. NPDC056831]|uniref:hypothetical protein n=1 Tax=Streptomyces sp. NPDC056831 TaxID=3345954 RepID=UPI0036BE2A99
MLGLLETREAAARERVEDLREAAARAAAVLEAAEIELDRRMIAREELVEALAVSAAETTAVTEAETEAEPAPVALSLRTYRRRVAELMVKLEADSRYQAGLRAGELGLPR